MRTDKYGRLWVYDIFIEILSIPETLFQADIHTKLNKNNNLSYAMHDSPNSSFCYQNYVEFIQTFDWSF